MFEYCFSIVKSKIIGLLEFISKQDFDWLINLLDKTPQITFNIAGFTYKTFQSGFVLLFLVSAGKWEGISCWRIG